MNNPCLSCRYKDRDKNRPQCLNCEKRLEYVGALGTMTHSLPIELTDMGMGKMEEKICNQTDCKFSGRPQPLENFYKLKACISKKNPEGIAARCKSCWNKKKEKKTDSTNSKPAGSAPEDFRQAAALGTDRPASFTSYGPCPPPGEAAVGVFKLSFEHHPELLEELKTLAEKELRTLENQIIYMLKKEIKSILKLRKYDEII